jgi:hypothetical protein
MFRSVVQRSMSRANKVATVKVARRDAWGWPVPDRNVPSGARRRREGSQQLKCVGRGHAPRDQRLNRPDDIDASRFVGVCDFRVIRVDHSPVSTIGLLDSCVAQIDCRREHETAGGLQIGGVGEQANHGSQIPARFGLVHASRGQPIKKRLVAGCVHHRWRRVSSPFVRGEPSRAASRKR